MRADKPIKSAVTDDLVLRNWLARNAVSRPLDIVSAKPDLPAVLLSSGTDLDALVLSAKAHGMLALLGTLAGDQAWASCAKHAQLIRAEHAKTTLFDALHRAALKDLSVIFAAEGVRGLVIKGAALGLSHYQSPGLRPRVDTDLFIDPNGQARAHLSLIRAGWAPLASNFSALVLPERTYQKRVSGAILSLDVHWALSSRPILARALPFEAIWLAARHYDHSPHWRMPAPIDALLIAAVHRIGHHRDQERFIWLYDLHLLWQAMPKSEQTETVNRATTRGLCAILFDGLKQSHMLFETALSADTCAQLSAAKNEPSAQLLQQDLSELRVDWRFASWRERIALVAQRLWADPEYLRQRFNAKSTPIVVLQLRRWLAIRTN